MAPGNRNRGRLDDVALDPALDKPAMNPKAVQSSLLNDHNLHCDAMALLGLRLQARKKDEQRTAITARTVGGPQPLRFAQFERGEQRVRVISDGGLDSGCGGLGLHRGLHAGVWKLSLPTQATVHPHRIFFGCIHDIRYGADAISLCPLLSRKQAFARVTRYQSQARAIWLT